jgi:exopolysaccharide biosynthesis polyprenyl glycosylphosphotransferase
VDRARIAADPIGLSNALREERRVAHAARRRQTRGSMLRRLLVVTDVVALSAAFLIIELLGGFHSGNTSFVVLDLLLLAFGIPAWILLAQAHNLYHADSRRADHSWTEELMPIVQMATLWSWTILMGISLTGIRPVTMPKLFVFWALTIGFLLGFRSLMRVWATRRSWYVQNAIVVGPPHETATVVRRILRHPEYRINLLACVDTIGGDALDELAWERELGSLADEVPLIRGEVDLTELVSEMAIDRLVFASGAKETHEDAETLCTLSELEVQIDLIPRWCDVVGRRMDFHELEGMPLLSVPRTAIRRSDLVRKRVFDGLLAGLALVVLSPVFALCALLTKLDSPGPVLFRQRRVGRDNRVFEVVKFRSMFVDAEERKQALAQLNFHGGGNDAGMFKVREDPRVTRVGRWLRRLSLDELPQLVNVLKGDMSLVGPRPLIENEDRQVEGRFRRRLNSSPGLTGPWQIHGRSEIPFEEMINLDYLYVTNWSMWGDVKLMLRTVRAVARGHGAY